MTVDRRLLWAAVSVALAAAAPAAASSGSADSSGTCTEAAVSLPVEPEDVEPFLPAGIKPQLTGGKKALLGLFAEQCSISLEGHKARPTKLGGAIVNVDFEREQEELPCPEAKDGQTYAFFWTTDRDALSGAWSSVGFFHGLVPSQTFEASRTAGIDSIKASVPFVYSPYKLKVTAPVPTVDFAPDVPDDPDDAFVSRHWQLGSKGWVRATFDHQPFLVSAGSGEVHGVQEGTPLYDMLGDVTSATGAGLILEFNYSGPFELCAK